MADVVVYNYLCAVCMPIYIKKYTVFTVKFFVDVVDGVIYPFQDQFQQVLQFENGS